MPDSNSHLLTGSSTAKGRSISCIEIPPHFIAEVGRCLFIPDNLYRILNPYGSVVGAEYYLNGIGCQCFHHIKQGRMDEPRSYETSVCGFVICKIAYKADFRA